MGKFHGQKTVVSLHSTESKVAICIIGWYVTSLLTLWTNRYVVAKLRVDSNFLSLAQLSMSVAGGLGSEIYLVGWTICKSGLRQVLDNGLKDMVLLAGARVLTVLLGLTALKYIAVSFTQTIKSSAPFFTVLLTSFLLGQSTTWKVNCSLIPIVMGLIFCSLSDSSFHVIGFVAALMSNCVDCIQNVVTKRLFNRSYSTSQLQFYTSLIAVVMQLMYIVYNWLASPPATVREFSETDRSAAFVFLVLILDGTCFYIQSAFAYALMSMVSPVTHSVINCVKRAMLVFLSIYHYGEDVTPLNWSGMVLVIVGVYGFNAASRLERENLSAKGLIAASAIVETSTIDALFEIRIGGKR